MLSKVVSISLLVIANLILLAHDVIPHHHHDDHVCFEHGSCATHHSNDSENEQRSADENEACCSLADLLIIPANSRFDEIISSCCTSFLDSGSQSPALITNTEFDYSKFLLPLLFRQHPQKTNFYRAFISLSAGLRAPPVF
ncbi:MAG: hypothetical protein IH597_09920 [Bacteroidales bacterium]|nr:hypothetical protein [Bacteroidales bacterium]